MIDTGRLLQNRYKIDRQIGQGGMGSVYIATDERFGSTVAIKQTLCMDDNYRRAIEREARLLNSLKHHSLPQVTDHFLEDNGQFLVMEYIPGEDLGKILEDRSEPFTTEQVLEWADQLLEALDFLHTLENPIIHRDVKPQNLKVTPKGKIVLLDFGLAKGSVTGAGNQTNSKSIFGYSRNYASLEQIQGTGTDPRSDLYSLAATLYHLITKVPPEDALTRAMAVLSQKPDPLVPANQIRPEIPAGVAAIIHMSLDLDAAERPVSAAAMREMLRSHKEFADLSISTVSVARASSTDIHSEPTRLMPVNTIHDGERHTQAKTNVYPDGDVSQVTSVRPLVGRSNERESGGSMKRSLAIAAALLILLGAGVTFGLYGSSLFLAQDEDSKNELVPPPSTDESQQQAGSSQSEAGSDSSESSSAPPAAERSRQADAQTAAKKTAPGREQAPDADGLTLDELDTSTDVRMEGEDVVIGKTRIKDGKIYLPDGTIMEDGGVRRPNQPRPPVITQEELRKLTPEERQKLRVVRRRFPGLIRIEPPKPPSTDQRQ